MTTKKTSKKKNNNSLPRFEVMIIAILLLGFIVWALSKCSQGTTTVNEDDPEVVSPAAADTPDNPTYDISDTEPATATNTPTPVITPPTTTNNTNVNSSSGTWLYVTLEGLKVREEPNLNGSVISVLNLHDRVTFLEQRTDFKQKIRLDNGEETLEPWFYIKTRKGHSGWVYGAGVHFFKWDRLNEPIDEME